MNRDIAYVKAGLNDVDLLLKMMGEYYAYDHLFFDEKVMRARLCDFLQSDRWGEISFIRVDGEAAGYFILLFGFGLEHGRNALIDEFYLRESFRRCGIGPRAVAYIEEICKRQGVSSLHADVEISNVKAQRFWSGRGFKKHDRNPHIKML